MTDTPAETAITRDEKDAFWDLQTAMRWDQVALLRGTMDGTHQVAILVHMEDTGDGYNMTPVAILVDETIEARLTVEGKHTAPDGTEIGL